MRKNEDAHGKRFWRELERLYFDGEWLLDDQVNNLYSKPRSRRERYIAVLTRQITDLKRKIADQKAPSKLGDNILD